MLDVVCLRVANVWCVQVSVSRAFLVFAEVLGASMASRHHQLGCLHSTARCPMPRK